LAGERERQWTRRTVMLLAAGEMARLTRLPMP